MTQMIIVHALEDADLVRGLCGALADFHPLALPVKADGAPLNFGPQVLVSMLWTPRAADLEARFAAMAAATAGRTLLLCDGLAASESLLASRPVVTEARQEPAELARLVGALQRAASRFEVRTPTVRPVASESVAVLAADDALAIPAPYVSAHSLAFSGGMVRGFASSVAMLGLGGVVTLGVGERVQGNALFGTDQADAHAAFATAAVEVVGATDDPASGFEPGHDVLPYDQMMAGAERLRNQAAEDRADVAQILSETVQLIETSREETQRTLKRLDTLSRGGGVFEAQAQAEAAAAVSEQGQRHAAQARPAEQKPVQAVSAPVQKPERIDPTEI